MLMATLSSKSLLSPRRAEMAEMQSAIDVFCHNCPDDAQTSTFDPTFPSMSEKMRLNLREGYTVLQAEPSLDYIDLAKKIGCTASILANKAESGKVIPCGKSEVNEGVVRRPKKECSEQTVTRTDLLAAFEPIMIEKPTFPPASGRLAPSFDNPTFVLSEDLGPYIRFIVSFDQRLEQQRLELSNLLVNGGRNPTKPRTTRASRAALEGGSKASTRRERWFPKGTNFARVSRTGGGKTWDEAALKYGITAARTDDDDDDDEKEGEELESNSSAFQGSSAASGA